MHIPDAAISPATSIAAGAAMLPVWAVAARKTRQAFASRQTPYLAIGAAFCFTLMMFNVPAPGGTTVHPVGGTLLAIFLGPWAAVLGMTVALVIQALFFGDGGVLAIGANCFTMAFAMPLTGYLTYRLAAGKGGGSSLRQSLAAGMGAYVGISAAALLTALILGLQPVLFHDAVGRALYFPFGLKVTLPAIMAAHLTIAGGAEAVVTVLAVRYLLSAGVALFGSDRPISAVRPRRELLWVGLTAAAALSPLGLLAKGEAWGEWDSAGVEKRAGYVPSGLAAAEGHSWKGFNLLPDYLSDRGPVLYGAAAAAGAGLILLVGLAAARLLSVGRCESVETTSPRLNEMTVAPGDFPNWLLLPQSAAKSMAPHTRRMRPTFLAKSLHTFAGMAEEMLLAESTARADGMLQRLDARVKIVCCLALVTVVSTMKHWPAVALLYVFALAIGAASGVPVVKLIGRVWMGVPLFMAGAVIPVMLNVVTPGPALLVLSNHPMVAITRPGLELGMLLLLRVVTAVSLVLLVSLTTRWTELLRGLRALLVPRAFTVVAMMTYRYLAVTAHTACEMFTARKSRSVGQAAPSADRRFVSRTAGALLARSSALSEEVHLAMLSRGWSGEPLTLSVSNLRACDALCVASTTVVALVVFAAERIG